VIHLKAAIVGVLTMIAVFVLCGGALILYFSKRPGEGLSAIAVNPYSPALWLFALAIFAAGAGLGYWLLK
jgi:hypothetical protein